MPHETCSLMPDAFSGMESAIYENSDAMVEFSEAHKGAKAILRTCVGRSISRSRVTHIR